MPPRPYLQLGIEALENIFDNHSEDASTLRQLQRELAHRSTDRANRLKARVASALLASLPSDLVKAGADHTKNSGGVRSNGNPQAQDGAIKKKTAQIDRESRWGETMSTQPEQADEFASLDPAEQHRLQGLYEALRVKLLDLTKRNRMLNYSFGARSKRHLQVVDEIPEQIYRLLVGENASLEVTSLPEPDDIPADEKTEEFTTALEHAKVSEIEYLTAVAALESNGRDDDHEMMAAERALRKRLRERLGMSPRPERNAINRSEHAKRFGVESNFELSKTATKKTHSDKFLQTLKYPDELESVLEKIRDDARLAEQEMGLSTLFLSFGFLEWYDSDSSDKHYFAPLLLLPVKLGVRPHRGKMLFSVSASSGIAEANLSLQKHLEAFNRTLPDFNTEDEETGGSIEAYFQQVQTAIEGLNRWRIRRWLVLGHFAFGRLAMYADLAPEKWGSHPATKHLIRSVLAGTQSVGNDALPSIPDDYEIDNPEIEGLAPYLIHDADASQHSALIDVAEGYDLVVEGPPGTGKSQTITNIIANAVASGKTVLFLAEKQAALEVVKRRLDTAGLGDFCLEIHSDKSSSKQIVEHLQQRIDLGFSAGRRPLPADDVTWADSRKAISIYLNALHKPEDDGRTLFDLIWKSLRGQTERPDALVSFKKVALPENLLKAPNDILSTLGQLDVYAHAAKSFAEAYGHPAKSPWLSFGVDNLPLYEVDALIEHLDEVKSSAVAILDCATKHSEMFSTELDTLRGISADGLSLSLPPDGTILSEVSALDISELGRILVLIEQEKELEQSLEKRPDLSQHSVNVLSRSLTILPLLRDNVGLTALTPKQLRLELERRSKQLEPTILAINELTPTLAILGLNDSFSTSGLEALSAAIICISRLTPQQRHWMERFHGSDLAHFEQSHQTWSTLSTAESEWRTRATNPSDAWPPAGTIASAATILGKGLIGSFIARIGSDHATAQSLIGQLGFQQDAAPTSGELFELSKHVEAVETFLADERIIGLLGDAWTGLETPFDDISVGLKIGAFLAKILSRLPDGELVMRQVLALDPLRMDALSSYENAAKNYRDLPEISRSSLAGSIASAISQLDKQLQTNRRILAADQDATLDQIEFSLEEIDATTKLMIALRDLQDESSKSPLISKARSLGSSSDKLHQARSAIEWTRKIASSHFPHAISQKLLGINAVAAMETTHNLCSDMSGLLESFDSTTRTLSSRYEIKFPTSGDLNELIKHLGSLINQRNQLSAYIGLRSQRQIIDALGLSSFLDRADSVGLDPDLLPSTLAILLAHARVEQTRRKNPTLSQHAGAILEARRSKFAERDREKINRDRETIKLRLLPAKPEFGNNAGPKKTWTEMALIRNELPKQRNFIPLRTLMSRAHRSVQALTPCFMMSPLSLAKFLPAGKVQFDLAIIDEASQMKPEDSLGGLLRAKQIVVVGDPKQLPPTDFFNRIDGAALSFDDDGFVDGDDESILEACQKAFNEVRRLKWHYRSRCESLIAFSNRNFYDNSLITFPMARPGSFSVDLIRVNGSYQARQNVAEALRIAEDAIGFMRHHADFDEEYLPTIGIVAVNTEQRDLIREELRRLSLGDSLVEEYQEKATKKGEPIFIKNLENVQGDERDFILISLTYGKEPGATALKQRFGPINGKQGHRRLNVLFSRARRRIVLFTSFGADDVKPTETSHRGVHILKQYLEYAESRGRAFVQTIGTEVDSDFEAEVADRLRLKGYEIDYQVGVSGYKIDLGVRHPDNPETFLVGIECDGAAYHSSKSARDRDRLREEVLRGLGWNLLRVWSTDWFHDPNEETRKLVLKIEALRSTSEGSVRDDEYHFAPVIPDETEKDPPLTETNRHGIEAANQTITLNGSEQLNTLLEDVTHSAINAAHKPDKFDITTSYKERLTPREAILALRELRDREIATSIPDWEPDRSIAREGMIEALVSKRVSDPDHWFLHIPQYLRQNTNKLEKDRYLERICDIIGRIDDDTR